MSFLVVTVTAIAGAYLPEQVDIAMLFASIGFSVYFQTMATKSAPSQAAIVAPCSNKTGGFFAVFMMNLVIGVGIFAGFLFFVIPAFILTARWMIAVPIVVSSQAGFMAAIMKSWELTKPFSRPITGAVFVVYLPLLASMGMTIIDAINGTEWTTSISGFALTEVALNISMVLGWYLAVAIYEQVNGNSETLSEIFA